MSHDHWLRFDQPEEGDAASVAFLAATAEAERSWLQPADQQIAVSNVMMALLERRDPSPILDIAAYATSATRFEVWRVGQRNRRESDRTAVLAVELPTPTAADAVTPADLVEAATRFLRTSSDDVDIAASVFLDVVAATGVSPAIPADLAAAAFAAVIAARELQLSSDARRRKVARAVSPVLDRVVDRWSRGAAVPRSLDAARHRSATSRADRLAEDRERKRRRHG